MAALLGGFIWSIVASPESKNSVFFVPTIPGVMGGITFSLVLVSYFAVPHHRLTQSAWANYFACLLTATALVLTTNGVNSAYISVFLLLLPLAAFFSWQMLAVSGFFAVCVLWQQYVIEHLTTNQLAPFVVSLILVYVGGIVLWFRASSSSEITPEDRSYHELASQLSQVAGTSEVVINAIDNGVVALDKKGTITLINPAAQQLIGWGNKDALGLNYGVVLKLINSKDDEVSELENPIARVLGDNKSVKDDTLSIKTQSGKSFLAGIAVSPIGALGDGVIVTFRDITNEKSDERQRAEFISTASHEMRTPVASIEGYLGLALNPQTATVDARAFGYISKAHDSAQHLGRLFADLLDISKADDHRLKNDPSVVDVVPFVQDIVDGLAPQAAEKGLILNYKPNESSASDDKTKRLSPIFYANVDNDHLREITQNLVENAVKYTPSGSVTVDVSGDNEHITISVADTGIGIPSEDQAHLFQKFYRVDNSDTREIGGT